jgi:hypothetical protein
MTQYSLSSPMRERTMALRTSPEIDMIEEFRLRRWARENYVPQTQRDRNWHPIVHDEMVRKDGESWFDMPQTTGTNR